MHKMPDGTMMKDSEHKMLWAAWQWVLVWATKKVAKLTVAPNAVALTAKWYKP
jgi:hypothetical protein